MTNWFVPGRLEVLGKHTDYAGGRSLLAAVSRGITISISDAPGDAITARSDASPDAVALRAHTPNGLPPGHWGHYVQTVIDRFATNFWTPKPALIEVTSDLPLASGMSSSSALIVATALALADHNGYAESEAWTSNIADRIDLAGYLAVVENGLSFGTLAGHRGVGTFGGSEDHTAMLTCRPDTLSRVRFCPIVIEDEVDFGHDHAFVVAVSGVLAEKTGAALEAYNAASLGTRELVKRWNEGSGQERPTLADALSEPGSLARLQQIVAGEPALERRLRAFITESDELIPAATAALASGDMAAFGQVAFASHENASRVLGNQIAETDDLVQIARELGALGATGFGAGFGGSVWALVPTPDADAFASDWLARYRSRWGHAASSAIVTRPGPSAHRL